MWHSLGKKIIRYRVLSLTILLLLTIYMGWKASEVKFSYDSNKAIPADNIKYIQYQTFLKQFGNDGNLIVVGIKTDSLFTPTIFKKYAALHKQIENLAAVNSVMSIPESITLVKDSVNSKFISQKIFSNNFNKQILDSETIVFNSLPIYKSLLYNNQTNAYLIGITVNKDTVTSKHRTKLINNITEAVNQFERETNIKTYISGLPYIRTKIADKLKAEMNYFLFASLALSAIVLFLFFRSFSATIMSLAVVVMGVVWSFGTMVLFGYKITLLTALIPPLIVVIGVPNCIYFLNKYHSCYKEKNDTQFALYTMIGRMGVVTLFCNIAAAIGFAVFALTKSSLLKEFGYVSSLNILALFFISLLFIPSILSFLSAPTKKEMKYLDNKIIEKILVKIERWAFLHSKWVYTIAIVTTLVSLAGIFKLKKEGFIVDDLPKKDVIYTDLKWFENNFNGIMPLEIIIDTKKKKGLQRSMQPIEKIEALSNYIDSNSQVAKPLSFIEGLKFSRQAFYDGDSNSYTIPTGMAEMVLMSQYMQPNKNDKNSKKGIGNLINNFIDSNKQIARISVNTKDIGSVGLPNLINQFKKRGEEIFDTTKYKLTFTGSCVTFLEGSTFIINGLKESIIYAFILIAFCMLYLFKSTRILFCSLLPNIIPLIITAGVMGWVGIALKPSTVLVFSVALGIVIDVTIRFLVNYKQELSNYNNNVKTTLEQTIKHTGISIIYTSLVLISGFFIFCFSSFGGTQALGWLTSLTLITGTITNLVLLPVLMLTILKKNNS